MTALEHVRFSMPLGSISGFLSLPSSLLSLIALLPMSASGQSETTASGLSAQATPFMPTMLSQIENTQSITTSFISSTEPNATASTSSTNTPISNDILPGTTGTEDRNESAFKFYWLILAIFGVAVTVFFWWINRRRKKRKERMRLSGRNALARDMEGWVNTRRWYHGAWRPNETRAFTRREEGLNENGEAPPPYRPKGDVAVAQDPVTRLSIPLRTLSREQVDAGRPPEYHEALSQGGEAAARPATGASHTNQFGTAGSPSRSSTRTLIQDHNDRGTTA